MNSIKPIINITPLIDVLLVLLIIFMIISPMRPKKIEARIPSETQNIDQVKDNPHTLIVTVNRDSTLMLNGSKPLGDVNEPINLQNKLRDIFSERLQNQVLNTEFANEASLPLKEKVIKTVFVKAPKSLPYGEVVKVIDAIKTVGANPIGLQIDNIQ